MQSLIKFIFTCFTVISVFCSNLFSTAVISPESENFDFSFLEYPKEAIITLEQAGLTEQELVGRASAQLPEYVQSGGYDDLNGITISPYYTAKVSGEEIPVYRHGSPCFLGGGGKGADRRDAPYLSRRNP